MLHAINYHNEEINLSDIGLDLLAELARTNLSVFPMLASCNKNPVHIEYIANKIQSVIDCVSDKTRLLMISVPPRHGKSELISRHLPAWVLGNYPRKRIILTSYAAELSDSNSDTAKANFERWGPLLWGVCPSPTMFNRSAWNTSQGGGVISAGVGGPINGFGADLFIIDDYVKNHEEAESLLIREKIWNWWQSVASTRLHPGAVVIILATRWHDDDLIGRMLKQMHKEKKEFPFEAECINLPALAEENDPLGRAHGEALWPWWNSREQLLDKKKTVGPYWWNALYQGSPVARGGTLFKSVFFRYWTRDYSTGDYLCHLHNQERPIRIQKNSLVRHVYVDPAIETKTTNDPTGMAAWGYSRQYKVWLLLDRISERIEHTQVMQAIKNFAFRNKCTVIGIENEKIGKVLVKQSAGNDQVGDMKVPFREIATKGLDKYARATPMASYVENERVFFPRDASWLADYESNLVRFPNAEHDEDVDVTGMAAEMENRISVVSALAGNR
ncbi:MAG: phage terminase large subunit [bacterium]